MQLTALAGTVLLALAAPAGAQPKAPFFHAAQGTPDRDRSGLPSGLRAALASPHELALSPLEAPAFKSSAAPGTPLRTGVHRTLPVNALDSGGWDATPDGGRVWRMAVRSPGASAIRIRFEEFSAGDGKVWLYSGSQVDGPYTSRGVFGNGQFWSGTIFASSVIVEYDPGPNAPAGDQPPFQLATISHRLENSPSPLAEVFENNSGDPADYCELDPNCFPDWRKAMSTVAQLIIETDAGQYACSGFLVSTRNDSLKPYLLTAGHCVTSEAEARSVQVFWTYQTSGCSSAPPRRADSLTSPVGANLLTRGTVDDGDFSLLLLRGVPPDVSFSGWDLTEPSVGTDLTGIHHPSGSYKRISFGKRADDGWAVVQDNLAAPGRFYQVRWEKGRVEPGSSGSPLFSAPGVVVGLLSYGPVASNLSACQIPGSTAGYSRLSTLYPYLKDYLEDLPASAVIPASKSLLFQGENGSFPGGATQTVSLNTGSATSVPFKARADASWIRLSAASGTLSAASPLLLGISVEPSYFARPGSYSSTVTVTSGAAPPQFIDIRVEMGVRNSAVSVTFNPDPVREQPAAEDGTRWTFRLQLDETAGMPTRLTALRINGTDYSGSIVEWFGADRLGAHGQLSTTLRTSGVLAAGDQYFEFGGVDEGSGRQWRQTATVAFLPLP